ncbi:hypothetical protein [Amycolatopsis anabasis]|uniref:hypothetical protein n=1 Tax=Amycolatopsis anabasis TaxID=1840409 RepID=UPI001C550EDB|nr:hypothetical protein [Amycolatopsis anabasis]
MDRSAEMNSAPRPSPRISDTTLRDSAHMPGVDFTPADGVAIAGLLRAVGVDLVEAGIVSTGDRADLPLLGAVLDHVGPDHVLTLVLARNRKQVREDLELARSLGCRAVMVSLPSSPVHARLKLGTDRPERILALARGVIGISKEMGLHTTFSAEDGARTDPGFLAEYVANGAAAGADRFRLAETVSTLRPDDTRRLAEVAVRAGAGIEVEIHSHNMLGLAVANALAAVDGGASWISTTVGGLGERGGNTPLAEVLTCLWRFHGVDRFDLTKLTTLTQEVERRSAVPLGATCGPTARFSYNYEIAGQWTHPEAFEAVPADLVGNQRRVRVRGRLRPALLRACLPPDLTGGLDLDEFVEDVLNHLPAGKATLDETALRSLALDFLARSTRPTVTTANERGAQ